MAGPLVGRGLKPQRGLIQVVQTSVADPERFDADPDPTFRGDADPDPAPDPKFV